jgi:hypothetical protein
VGLLLHVLQIVGLKPSGDANCGTKSVYTSYISHSLKLRVLIGASYQPKKTGNKPMPTYHESTCVDLKLCYLIYMKHLGVYK